MSANLQDPAIRKTIRDALGEASASLTRIEAERDLIKETAKNIEDSTGLPKKIFRKMLVTYHKQNFNEVTEEHEEFETAYDTLWNTKQS